MMNVTPAPHTDVPTPQSAKTARRKPLTLALLGLVAAAAALSYIFWSTSVRLGEATTLIPRFDGQCRKLTGLAGVEDMEPDLFGGRIVLSSDDRRRAAEPSPPRGALYLLPAAGFETWSDRTDITGGVPADFHPQGLSLFQDGEGNVSLFVVNHPGGASSKTPTTVEIYDLIGGRARHRRTVTDPRVARMNDVAAISHTTFYVTNETQAARGSLGEFFNVVANAGDGSIWFFNGVDWRKADSGLGFANSLAYDQQSNTLYATATIHRALRIYDVNRSSGALTLQPHGGVFLGTGVDNITFDDAGGLLIASHPKMMTFAAHARDQAKRSPSQILYIDPVAKKADQIYLTLGEPLSGASVAVKIGRQMLIGSVFEPFILACDLPQVWKHSQAYPARPLAVEGAR
jgi:arylesterase/paraoxonase